MNRPFRNKKGSIKSNNQMSEVGGKKQLRDLQTTPTNQFNNIASALMRKSALPRPTKLFKFRRQKQARKSNINNTPATTPTAYTADTLTHDKKKNNINDFNISVSNLKPSPPLRSRQPPAEQLLKELAAKSSPRQPIVDATPKHNRQIQCWQNHASSFSTMTLHTTDSISASSSSSSDDALLLYTITSQGSMSFYTYDDHQEPSSYDFGSFATSGVGSSSDDDDDDDDEEDDTIVYEQKNNYYHSDGRRAHKAPAWRQSCQGANAQDELLLKFPGESCLFDTNTADDALGLACDFFPFQTLLNRGDADEEATSSIRLGGAISRESWEDRIMLPTLVDDMDDDDEDVITLIINPPLRDDSRAHHHQDPKVSDATGKDKRTFRQRATRPIQAIWNVLRNRKARKGRQEKEDEYGEGEI